MGCFYLSGPTSFAPIIEAAVKIVEESGGQFHVLVIIADGQVLRLKLTIDIVFAYFKFFFKFR